MSDIYPRRDPLVNICDHTENQLNYVKKQREAGFEVVLWLGIKQKALMKWYEMKQLTEEFKYIDMLNGSIPASAIIIDRENKGIEDRLACHSLRFSRTCHKIPEIVRLRNGLPKACSDIPHGYTDLCIHL